MSEKKEYCLNCGNECHEGILKRTEKGYASEGSNEYEIIACLINNILLIKILFFKIENFLIIFE